jgi:hypothetical protein
MAIGKQRLPSVDSCSPESQSIQSLCGLPIATLIEQNIDVLWLSPTIFISCFEFQLGGTCPYDFRVDFNDGDHEVRFFVYSLSAFGSEQRVPCSSLPIDFCRHLIALLPVNYFSLVGLSSWNGLKRFPLEYFLQFLSIIPPDAQQMPPRRADFSWTTIDLLLGQKKVNKDDLRAILSHQFHPAVKLSLFDGGFDESVSKDVFCNLLQEAPHLRAVEIPGRLLWNDKNPSLDFQRVVLKSPNLTSFMYRTPVAAVYLLSFAKIHGVTDMQMNFAENLWTWASDKQECRAKLHSFISPFFQEDSILERLSILFEENGNYGCYYQSRECLFREWLPGIFVRCTSREFCFFNVSVKQWNTCRKLDHVQLWDEVLFPSLSLNYWQKYMTKPVEASSLAVKAINECILYQQTTDHIPYNPNTTNAGVIFSLLKTRFKNLCMDLKTWRVLEAEYWVQSYFGSCISGIAGRTHVPTSDPETIDVSVLNLLLVLVMVASKLGAVLRKEM